MVDSAKPTVLITGVTGYLGSHVTLLYLQDGGYNVRGTVRDTKNEKKLEPIKKAFGDLYAKLELRAADLTDKASILAAAEGVDYIVHTASPFTVQQIKDEEKELIRPAVDGTLAAMEAALQNKVKRIVITSSTVSVVNQKEKDKPKDYTWNETYFSNSEKGAHIDPYSRSKSLAEEAAWKFKEDNKHIHDIEIVTINPSLILGPAFVGAGFASGDIISMLILGKAPGVPKIQFGLVDVRDVALAHLNALKVPEAANKRFILCCESWFFHKIGKSIERHWKPQGYTKVTKKELP